MRRHSKLNEIMPNVTVPLILAIETATRAGSLALSRGAEILSSAEGNAAESHSISLLEAVEDILQQVGVQLNGILLFAAASGAGSFSGFRSWLATAKGPSALTGR